MKSIKEKSEEHAPCTREDSWNKAQKCIIAQTSFEAGANYVLEQIEQLIYEKHIEGNLPLFDLTYLIDKLKEK
jgi:hypothetical protein